VGVDLSLAKVSFGLGELPWARFACGDATHLPFADAVFDRVLCRDVLHHLPPSSHDAALREIVRVCRPGGEVVLIEPNARNPLIGLFALLVPAERGALRIAVTGLKVLAAACAAEVQVEMAQPLPLARALLHYRSGRPDLATCGPVIRLLDQIERVARRMVPRACWAYVIVRARTSADREVTARSRVGNSACGLDGS
jgi:SAM-dependent methyltransferase